ncbi:MAG: EamA family transporter [bacterium]|nr:EamA family transporter [bacterium]
MLCGSICGAYASVYIAGKKSPVSPVLLNSVQIFLGGLFLLFISLLAEGFNPETFSHLEPRFFIALLWLSSISAVGFSIWFYLLKDRMVPVTTLSIWKFIVPVTGAILSWILIPGENPDIFSIGGMVTIALAVIVFFSGHGKRIKK